MIAGRENIIGWLLIPFHCSPIRIFIKKDNAVRLVDKRFYSSLWILIRPVNHHRWHLPVILTKNFICRVTKEASASKQEKKFSSFTIMEAVIWQTWLKAWSKHWAGKFWIISLLSGRPKLPYSQDVALSVYHVFSCYQSHIDSDPWEQ